MPPESVPIEGGLLRVPDAGPTGVRCFKGIPYAEPPVGRLRWRPPQPVAAWSGVRGAETFGPNSMQGVVFDDIDPLPAGVSEDCLYLNIWTPSLEPGDAAPVMVWIHGGGFVVGSGAEPRYDGTNLAAKGIVVVTVNHRLNALGFLAHPALTEEVAGPRIGELRDARPGRPHSLGSRAISGPLVAIPRGSPSQGSLPAPRPSAP